METWFYDTECFKNFFSVIFKKADTGDVKSFYIHDDHNDIIALASFLKQEMWLIGFNNHKYDDLLLAYIQMRVLYWRTTNQTIEDLYNTSQYIINYSNNYYDERIKNLKYYNSKYRTIDLMRILAFDKLKKGLKHVAINLKWHRIQDLPYKHYANITKDIVDIILDYNLNDVLITEKLAKQISNVIKLRFDIVNKFKLHVTSSSDSNIADKFLNKFYAELTGLNYQEFKDKRTYRKVIKVSECISKKIKFKSDEFNKLLDDLNSLVVTSTVDALERSVIYNGVRFDLGTGGLHSKDKPGKFIKTKDTLIIDADVTSYYPYLIISERIIPAHLRDEFIDVVKLIVEERVKAKKEGDKIKSAALKITVNSGGFGKMNFEYFWLYDPKAMIQVTLNGQLFLLMLIEKLTMAGFNVISANTDGIVTLVPKCKQEEYKKVCKEWEVENNFNLEYTFYTHYIRTNVNTYIARSINGNKEDIKRKGHLDKLRHLYGIPILSKTFNMPIVAQAVEDYYLKGIPIMDTFMKHDDIYDFCRSRKIGKQFTVEYHIIKNNNLEIINLQPSVRYFVSNDGGTLYTRKDDKNLSHLCKGFKVTIFNDAYEKISNNPDCPLEGYNIDYNYYRIEANKFINQIESGHSDKKQIKLNLYQGKLF